MVKEFEIQGRICNLLPEMTEEEFWHKVIGFIEEHGWSFGGGLEMEKISGCVSDTSPDMTVEEFEKTFCLSGWEALSAPVCALGHLSQRERQEIGAYSRTGTMSSSPLGSPFGRAVSRRLTERAFRFAIRSGRKLFSDLLSIMGGRLKAISQFIKKKQ